MNTLFLFAIAGLSFAFGYRFFAKLLALGVFQLSREYSASPSVPPPSTGELRCHRHLLFGYHSASLTLVIALLGGILASAWGWIPALLWAVIGSALAAGIYGIGSLWLATRHPDTSLAELLAHYVGRLAPLLWFLGLALLVALGVLCALLLAGLLAAYPHAAAAFWLLVLLALGLGRMLRAHDDFVQLPAYGIALVLMLAGIGVLMLLPVSFSGALHFDVRGASVLTLGAVSTWLVLVMAYGLAALRTPLTRLARPRGVLSILLLAVLLLIALASAIVDRPALVAPEFHAPASGLSVFPWLFLTLTSGAIAGFHLLVARGLSSRQLRSEADVRYIGYGGAVVDGLVAVGAIAVVCAGFADTESWRAAHADPALPGGLHDSLVMFIDAYARLAAELGLPAEYAQHLAAVTIMALAAAGLETALRLTKQLLDESAARLPPALSGNRSRFALTVGVPLVLALSALWLEPAEGWWPLFGAANLLFALAGLALLWLALRAHDRPQLWVALVAIPLGLLLIWGLTELVLAGWQRSRYLLVAAGLALLLGFVLAGWQAWRTRPSA